MMAAIAAGEEVTLAARVTGRRGLSLPESFGVDAVEAKAVCRADERNPR